MDNVQKISDHGESLRKSVLFVAGWISAVLSLFIYPFVFGMIGVVSGILATKNNKSRLGVYLVVASIVLMGVGLAFSTKLLTVTMTYLKL
jgi:hypothetical protein